MITKEEISYTKEMLLRSQKGFQELQRSEFHKICERLTDIWGSPSHNKTFELETEVSGVPVHAEYYLCFCYNDSKKHPMFNIETGNIEAANIIVPAEQTAGERADKYNKHQGYFRSRVILGKDDNAKLIVMNPHDITEFLMQSESYEELMQKLILEDAEFPFREENEQSILDYKAEKKQLEKHLERE